MSIKPSWFSTATPKFLLDLLQNRHYDLQNLTEEAVGDIAFLACEPEDMGVQSVLLQTGYLTIKGYNNGLYKLGFPNFEVKKSFYDASIRLFRTQRTSNRNISPVKSTLR